MAGVDTNGVAPGLGDVAQAASTAELTKMIRRAGEALDRALQTPNADYFGAQLEGLRNDNLELFRRLLVRNPYSSHRKDVVRKMWFRTIYPSIEQYRANIRQLEAALALAHAPRSHADGGRSSSNTSTSSGDNAGSADAVAVRRELSKWRARFQTFLQAASGVLQRLVAELAEAHALAAVSAAAPGGAAQVLDRRTLATHVLGADVARGLRTELDAGLTAEQRATLAVVAKLLTHLGDLARYRILYTSRKPSDGDASAWQAPMALYRSAIRVAPHRGQAYNQLAVLHGYERNSLDSVFAYYRALTAQYGFDSAVKNLRTLLDGALRAVDAPAERAGDASGYVYCEQRTYARFTHLRYLFAFHQPRAEAPPPPPVAPGAEAQLVAEVRGACTAFVRGVASGAIEERQAVTAQAIHLLELQQLACLGAGAKETPRHDAAIARVSAAAVAIVAEHMCHAVRCSVADAQHRARELKSEADLLSRASRRVAPALVPTLLWLVAACVRVARDAASRDCLAAGGEPVSALKAQVFCAAREHGLLDAVARLKRAIEDAHARVSRRSPLPPPIGWTRALESMDAVAARLWAGAASTQRIEDELLTGWQLPDGSVWGRCPAARRSPAQPGDVHRARWAQLHCLLALAHEALPRVLDIIDGSTAAQSQLHDASDHETESETITFQGRPPLALSQASDDSQSVPPTPQQPRPPARVQPLSPSSLPPVPASMLAQLRQAAIADPAPDRKQATPLVDAERDEVVSPANTAQRAQQLPRQAIGAQRASAAAVSAGSSGPLFSVQTTLAQSPPTDPQSAIYAWQQYQREHQRKLELQHQLEHQQRIQLQLQQQLLAQHQSRLDPTTASVVSMALSTPQQHLPESAAAYNPYAGLPGATPVLSAQQASTVPSLHPSLSLSSVASTAYPWTSPLIHPAAVPRSAEFGLHPMPAPFTRPLNSNMAFYPPDPVYFNAEGSNNVRFVAADTRAASDPASDHANSTGTLSISDHQLVFYSESANRGFAIDYPSIVIHAASGESPDDTHLYCQLDCLLSDAGDEQPEDAELLTELRFYLNQHQLDEAFQAMC
ncbi:hypothetical protein IWW52_000118, partial [Coemansia sp. RSA 2704]